MNTTFILLALIIFPFSCVTTSSTNPDEVNWLDKGATPQIVQNSSSNTQLISNRDESSGIPHTAIPLPNSGSVLKVIDGNTIEISNNSKTYLVRYIGVANLNKGSAKANQARELNQFLVEGKTVTLTEDDSLSKTLEEHILYRYVYIDGESINKRMLTSGLTKFANEHGNFLHREEYLNELNRINSVSPLSGSDHQKLSCGTLPCKP